MTAILIGEHFQTLEAIKIISLEARYRHLDQWLGFSGFKQEIKPSGSVHIDYNKPEKLEYTLSDNKSLCFYYGYTIAGHNNIQTESHINQKSYLRIESIEPRHINELTDDLMCISQ